MTAVIDFLTRRLLPKASTDDHFGGYAETEGLLNSLYINLVLFAFFMIFFEANRHMKSTYLKRATKKFKVGASTYFDEKEVLQRKTSDHVA